MANEQLGSGLPTNSNTPMSIRIPCRDQVPAMLALVVPSFFGLVAFCGFVVGPASAAADDSVAARDSTSKYLSEVKPLLKAKCFACHGPIKQEAGLRLDTVSAMKRGGDSGPSLDADSPLESILLERVSSDDESDRMPPQGEPMTRDQIAMVEAWLKSGAKGPADEKPQVDPKSHWAFQPLPPRRQVKGRSIDYYVGKRLRTAGLHGAEQAGARMLIRRMYLDLQGLPPTPAELDHWTTRFAERGGKEKSRSDKAGARHNRQAVLDLIDELLASPRYGERWAQHWLVIVRYADTHGFEVNTPRPNAWRYRDYVIRAFNADKPYDKFVMEQLAGDTLGADTATGFLVAAAALLPGQIGKDKASMRLARQDSLDEIVVGVGTTFLGLTVGCSRCHDHKFDPISQSDYYSMQAFFAGVDYGDREIRDASYEQRMAEASRLGESIEQVQSRLSSLEPKAFTAATIVLDDDDPERVTTLQKRQGHGENAKGDLRGTRGDKGDKSRVANLSGGRYAWWRSEQGRDLFSWNPKSQGRFRIWVSWGVNREASHVLDARYVLDLDGDLKTNNDQRELASVDQRYFSGTAERPSPNKPAWSGLHDIGVHELTPASRLVLRGGKSQGIVTADTVVLQAEPSASAGLKRLPKLRGPVDAGLTVEAFSPLESRFIRFTSLATNENNRYQPCLDELEVFSASDPSVNVALAKRGAKASSSGNYSNTGRHQLKHINDGKYGNSFSWISDELGRGWVQLEFAQAEQIGRIEWARDREGKYKDRLPIRYRIESSVDGINWRLVASSSDRVPMGTPHDHVQSLLRNQSDSNQDDLIKLDKRLRELKAKHAGLIEPRKVFGGTFREPDKTFVLRRGDPEQPTEMVAPRALSIFGGEPLASTASDSTRRTTLASWVASSQNPLTARVIANRVWQYHFGVGIVETSSDFGLNGASPSHPELLDWLANEFIHNGWSLKKLHRLIMSSDCYQQSSIWRSRQIARVQGAPISSLRDPFVVDADCRLLWRFPSRRLDAESIRDCLLAVSGQLNLEAGGPGFNFFKTRGGLSGFPPVEEFSQNELRRMIYAHKIRMEPVPVFGAFDCPDAGLPTPRRGQSTTAIQALNLFNSPFVLSQAEAFAERIKREDDTSIASQVKLAFRLALGRSPTSKEAAASKRAVDAHGLPTLCRAIFNSSEFLFVP